MPIKCSTTLAQTSIWGALLFGALLLGCLFEAPARAETTIEVLGSGRVSEFAHKLEIDWSAQRIEVVETITLSNVGRGDAEAIYRFDLPAQSAISALQIEDSLGHHTEQGVVGHLASTNLIAGDGTQFRADTGLLRMIATEGDGQDDLTRYELRVFPVPAKRSTVITLRWQSPVRVMSGHFSVTLPNRGDSRTLSRSEVILTAPRTMSPFFAAGNTLSDARAVGKNLSYRFFAPVGALSIQGPPAIGTQVQAEVALIPLTANSGIAAVRVVQPAGQASVTPNFERALVVVDVSKSLGRAGRDAAAELVDTLLSQLGPTIQVEAILYDRQAHRVLGSWQEGSRSTRRRIAQAIQTAPMKNGSKLDRALTLAATTLGPARRKADRSLLIVVTDRMLPTTTEYSDLEAALGHSTFGVPKAETRILAAILVPPKAPLPNLHDSAISALVYEARGRIAAIRYGDVTTRGASLLRQLRQPAPLQAMGVRFDRGQFIGAQLQEQVAPGESAMAFGYYRGGVPGRVTVVGVQAGKRIRVTATRLPPKIALGLARITLSTTHADAFPDNHFGDASRRAFRQAASKLSVVTEVSALVAIDKADGFARDRLALANTWGGEHYRRMPPPPEQLNGEFRAFAQAKTVRLKRRGKTGELEPTLIARLIRSHVIAPVRHCYESRLGRSPKLAGALILHLEIARGEVHEVKLLQMPPSLEPLRKCIVDAAYAIPFPRVHQGDKADLMYVANYPLRFRRVDRKGNVMVSPADAVHSIDETTDPLFGLPE